MDSDEEYIYDCDSGNESSGDDVGLEFEIEGEGESGSSRYRETTEDYPYEVLSTEDITRHMIDCIKEVNSVVNIPVTTTRILLNHFKWDKEKLMERFYDGDQEKLFSEAHVVSPFKTPSKSQRVTVKTSNGMEECEICFLNMPSAECPKCKVTIEKDGGCNHMVCKNQSCKADFCWVCLGPWEPHGSSWYSCNRYDEDEAKQARDAQEKSRAALQRYLFYCNRYMNHMQSLKFEHKLYASVKEKMEEMQQHNMSWIEVQFLKKAVDILCECRQTLMFTYVFAYYLRKNNQSVIFEDNQKDVESATETLSEYLERDITQENLADIKQKVQDKYR
ncbi:E3 ubiquitin-protein ligase arih1 [Portunus trituberculatus]|uniref:E3 ubiquitin-protein ligase arih1 n=1 Tax=Portunus trituberculatus TaxID=210409 RepID=A0A5B7EG26_PORTR|nr:E3 ubiquitin-protein ligase arih1 [Portunus trituberculatus]